MANITIHAGDFGKGKGTVVFPLIGVGKNIGIVQPLAPGEFSLTGAGKQISVELDAVEVASEESVKRLGGTIGWGVVGATLLGPVGLLAGLLAGGNRKEVTFVATFKGGKRMLATADNGTFKKLSALVF